MRRILLQRRIGAQNETIGGLAPDYIPEFSMEYISNDNMFIISHYMLATEVIEYSDEVRKLIRHKTMLKTASWGRPIYIDWDEYCEQREDKIFSSMLSVKEGG